MNARVRGQNLTYSIGNHIGISIVTGVCSADNPIPIEAELCREYDASRPVLRGAVRMLTARGLLGAPTLAANVAGPEAKAAISHAIERMQAADRGDDDPLDSDAACVGANEPPQA